MVTTQQAITQALVGEWNAPQRGCLLGLAPGLGAGYSQSLNSCDWSPPALVQYYMGRFELERQNDFARCVNDTGDNFANNASMGAKLFSNPVLQTTDFRQSLYLIETFLSDYETRDALNAAYQAELKATEQTYLNTTTSLPATGTSCAVAPNQGVAPRPAALRRSVTRRSPRLMGWAVSSSVPRLRIGAAGR